MTKNPGRGITKLPDGRLKVRARGIDPRTGKRKEKERIVEDLGIKKARALQQELRAEIRAGVDRKVRRMTLSDYAQSWLKARKAGESRVSTLEWQVQVLEDHILPVLGDHFVDGIRGQDVRDWLTQAAMKMKPPRKIRKERRSTEENEVRGEANPQRYDSETVNGWLKVLKTLLRDAVADLDLERDPTLRIHSLSVEPGERKSLEAEELQQVLAAMRELLAEGKITRANYSLILAGFFTGMRWSELTALEWRDLDEHKGCLYIQRGQVLGHVAGTKTRKNRTVAVPEIVLEALREHRQVQLRTQSPGLDKGIIFPSETGGYRFTSSIKKTLNNICARAELGKRVTPHWMRHTFNNLLRQAKVDHVVLRATTGHQTEAMTEHYSHVTLEEKKEATARVIQMVGCAEPKDEKGDRRGEPGGINEKRSAGGNPN